jgi:hypothetical protein
MILMREQNNGGGDEDCCGDTVSNSEHIKRNKRFPANFLNVKWTEMVAQE